MNFFGNPLSFYSSLTTMLGSGVCSLMCRDCGCHGAGSWPPLSLLPGDDVRVEQFLRCGWVPSAPSELGRGEAVTVMCTLYMRYY